MNFTSSICEISAKILVLFVVSEVNPKNPDDIFTGILIGYSLRFFIQLPASCDGLKSFEVHFKLK
ncbi:hypothetical protein CQ022_01700 [Chryseobacterium culicis]|uniref:Uncharacterized protein n=1 Tax=Chryseobacterium culicis TaxID=680127 RepID=A0A2S9CX21_CHRCI|nr:hypothetical protein CQ022_01700 [Chryseobacterium culicis]PRB91270.1 hypothetical protein CQ033_11290 [Chryseobacterium culicis]